MLDLLALALALPSAATLAPAADEADERYAFLARLAEEGMLEMVVKEAEGFLREHPRHAKAALARYRLACALFDLGRLADSRPHFEALAGAEGFELRGEAEFRLAQCELERGEPAAAEAVLARLLARGAGYLERPATFLSAEAAFRLGRHEDADARYAAVLAGEGGEGGEGGDYAADALHGRAWCASRLGRHDDALRHVADFLRRWPREERAGELRFVAGESELAAGRAAEALASFERVEDGPFHDAALRGAAFAAAALGRHADAARRFGALLEAYPESRYAGEARLYRGIHLLKAGDAQAALAALAPAEGAPPDAEAAFGRARASAEIGDHAGALALLEAARAGEAPAELRQRIDVARGDALFALGRAEEAAAAYEAAGSDYALHAAAIARLNAGEAEDAVRLASLVAAGEGAHRVEAHLTLGEGHFTRADYGPAEAAFRVVLEEDADAARRARALARLGWCRYLTGDAAGAAEHFAKLLAEHGGSAEAEEARFMRARSLEEAGEEQGARAEYARYLERHADAPRADEARLRLARMSEGAAALGHLEAILARGNAALSSEARFELAERLAGAGRHAEAEPHYRRLVEDAGGALTRQATYGLAWSLYSLERWAEAAELLRALGADRGAPEELALAALELAVWAERRAGSVDGARRAYEAFAARCADDARLLEAARELASALGEAGRGAEAQAAFGALLARTKDRGVAVAICVERAFLALDAGAVDEAAEHARAAQRHAPGDAALAEALFHVGEAYFEAGRDREAAECYELAAPAAGERIAPFALYKAGFAHLRAERDEAAAQRFGELVEHFGGHELAGEGLYLHGEALFRSGRLEEALVPLERVLAEHRRHQVAPKAMFRLGVARAGLGRWREAADVLAQLSRTHAGFEHALEAELWRGRALAALGERRGARAAHARVVEGDRGVLSARARLELGGIAEDESALEEALAEYLKVALLYAHGEEVAEALFRAGSVLERQGEPDKARAQYRKAVADHGGMPGAERARARLSELGG